MPPSSDWDTNPELESAVWQASQRLSPAMAKKMYGFMKRTWSTALAELRRDDKAPDRPEDRRTHFVRAWISDTLWRLYQAGENWSAEPASMGIDTAEAQDVFSRVLSRPRVLPDEAGGRLPVPSRQWHVVTQAVEDTFEELSEARVADTAERKKKRPAKPKPAKGQASRSHAASSHDSWNADIPFWARKIRDRDNDTAYRSNSWQGDDQSKDFDRGKGKDRGREKGKEKGREKGKEKGKGKGKGKDKGRDGTADRCQSDSPLRTGSRSRTIEERLGGKLPTPRRSRSRGARDRSRRRPGRKFETGAGRRRASRSRRRRAGGRRRRSVIRHRRPRSAGRTAREDARRARTETRRSRSAKRGPTGPRSPFGGLRSVSPKMSPKMSPKALKLSEPPEPTAQSKAKPAKARSCSASSDSSYASMETRPKPSAKTKAEKEEKEEAQEVEEKEREEESEREVDQGSPMSEAKLPEPEAKSKAKGCSSSGSDSSDGSARPQRTKRQGSQEATKDKSEHEKSEEERQDAVEDGVKAEVEAGEVFADVEDAVDLEADFDDIDDEKLMAQLQQGLMKVEEAEDTNDAAEPVELVECVNRNRGTCLALRAENGEDQKLEHKLLFADDTVRGGLFTGMYCIKCAKIVEYSWRNVAAA
ncbi:unnamed protein product [Symbiodinium sp. CCMP2456]|nr:unnamed protein product [Symbiodinium sp. CCMP2456]